MKGGLARAQCRYDRTRAQADLFVKGHQGKLEPPSNRNIDGVGTANSEVVRNASGVVTQVAVHRDNAKIWNAQNRLHRLSTQVRVAGSPPNCTSNLGKHKSGHRQDLTGSDRPF